LRGWVCFLQPHQLDHKGRGHLIMIEISGVTMGQECERVRHAVITRAPSLPAGSGLCCSVRVSRARGEEGRFFMTVTQPSKAEVHWVRSKFQLIVFLAMAVALAALSAGLLVGCGSDTNAEDTQGVASAETIPCSRNGYGQQSGRQRGTGSPICRKRDPRRLDLHPPGRTEEARRSPTSSQGMPTAVRVLGLSSEVSRSSSATT